MRPRRMRRYFARGSASYPVPGRSGSPFRVAGCLFHRSALSSSEEGPMRRCALLLLPALVACCNGSAPSVSAQEPDLATPAPLVDATPPAAREALRKALAAVDEQRIADTIAHLAAIPTRSTCSDPSPQGTGIGAARDWIRARFDAI